MPVDFMKSLQSIATQKQSVMKGEQELMQLSIACCLVSAIGS
jgi:hypothetical protein